MKFNNYEFLFIGMFCGIALIGSLMILCNVTSINENILDDVCNQKYSGSTFFKTENGKIVCEKKFDSYFENEEVIILEPR